MTASDNDNSDAPVSQNPAETGSQLRVKRPAGLGRGLSALLGDSGGESRLAGNGGQRDAMVMLPITDVHPHPEQPRRVFSEEALAELSASIAEKGVIQPIIVRPAPDGTGWQIVAGERRWRASGRAGLQQIPAFVRNWSDADVFTIALVENIQRQDLNAIEEAEAYARLRDQLGHAQEAIAKMTGKSRSHIANLLRLLDLPVAVRAMLADGAITMGHARALVGHDNAEGIAQQIVQKGLSVRNVEALVRGRRGEASGGGEKRNPDMGDADLLALTRHLGDMLGVAVTITHDADSMTGILKLGYSNLEQLDMLCQRLSGERI
ncbi:MAG: ParB/RepB/Spo0J family partition protein [Sphingopyxis sp.]|nr:ParB/RepB/Spo0J family partition protein [Sphingopyxis sp.]